jgi:NhaA family Na+:H+ antiporter
MPENQDFILTRIFKNFFESGKAGGFILIACTIISMVIANGGSGEAYHHFWESKLNLSFQNINLDYSVEEWINDGLMTIFFLMVGLEIERELYVGELSDFKNALLSIVAAIGGMAVPALIHFSFNHGTPTQAGIGIPMATDIAFSLGMLSLLGNKVPPALKIFLTALAIIDDLGAVVIIAVFYTKEFSAINLFIALGIFAFLILLNKLNVYKTWIYLVAGVFMWYFMLKSGVHATISGVLLAFAIPFRKNDAINPSYKLQHVLHNPVNFIIVPLFAFANTGIHLATGWYNHLYSNNSVGIIAGLVTGKPIGIFVLCWIAVKLKWCSLPESINWKILLGAGALAGIGFTMSIFITNLAFRDSMGLIEDSKISVLLGSLIAVIIGLMILFFSCRRRFSD